MGLDNRVKLKDRSKTDHYQIALFSLTHGDYAEILHHFDDPNKKGLFLADTCGHTEGYGNSMSFFLQEQESHGWGMSGNPERDLHRLSQNIPYRNKDWSDCICAQYAFIDGEDITISNAGLPRPIKVCEDGTVEELDVIGTYLNHIEVFHKPPITTQLKKGEVLFLQSDGIEDNINFSVKAEKGLLVYNSLESMLKTLRHQPANVIRSEVRNQMESLVYPRDDNYDDFSFIVVTRK